MTDRRAGPGGLTEVHQKYYLYHYSHLHLTFLILKRSLMIAKTNFIFFHVGAGGLCWLLLVLMLECFIPWSNRFQKQFQFLVANNATQEIVRSVTESAESHTFGTNVIIRNYRFFDLVYPSLSMCLQMACLWVVFICSCSHFNIMNDHSNDAQKLVCLSLDGDFM